MNRLTRKRLAIFLLVGILLTGFLPTPMVQVDTAYAGISTNRTLKPDKKYSQDVYLLQSNLYGLGYDCGYPDGVYGERTIRAVKAFQKDYKLRVTGNANKKTLTKLNKICASLQRTLTQKKFGTLLEDGLIGEATTCVINRAKSAMGLKADGIAHKRFRKKLASYKVKAVKVKAVKDKTAKIKTVKVKVPAKSLLSTNLGKTRYILQAPKTCKASSLAMVLNLITGTSLYSTKGMGNNACRNVDGGTIVGSNGCIYMADYKTDDYVGSAQEQIQAINQSLNSGLPIVAAVHSTKSGETKHHWVVIVGKSGNDYLMVDPNVGKSGTSMKEQVRTMSSCSYTWGLADYATLHYGYIAFGKW